jgi:hypothetical protein
MKQTSDHLGMRKWCERGRTKKVDLADIQIRSKQPRADRQEVESEGMKAHRERSKRYFKRKGEEPRNDRSRGVNIPQMSQLEMRKVREGLLELFRTLVNSMMKELQARAKDWDA